MNDFCLDFSRPRIIRTYLMTVHGFFVKVRLSLRQGLINCVVVNNRLGTSPKTRWQLGLRQTKGLLNTAMDTHICRFCSRHLQINVREFKQTKTTTATGTSPNEGFCPRFLETATFSFGIRLPSTRVRRIRQRIRIFFNQLSMNTLRVDGQNF